MTRIVDEAELRNDSAAVMDALEAGEDFILTRNGRPVGELRPLTSRSPLATTELKARLARFAGTAKASDERAEIDITFGADRLDG